jgi:hypothetical protein
VVYCNVSPGCRSAWFSPRHDRPGSPEAAGASLSHRRFLLVQG